MIFAVGFVAIVLFVFVCGCPCLCISCTDFFTRADSTDINTGSPCGWTEVAGSWEIASNFLKCTAANSIAISSTTYSDYKQSVIVRVKFVANNDLYRVIINYLDSSNYHALEFKPNTATSTSTLKLIKVVGGTPSTLSTDTATLGATLNDFYELSLCVNQGESIICAIVRYTTGGGMTPYLQTSSVFTAHTNGFSVGLGTGATLSSSTNFTYYLQRHTRTGCTGCACPECSECLVDADGIKNTVGTMKVVLSGITNDTCAPAACTSLNATWYASFSSLCLFVHNSNPPICGGVSNTAMNVTVINNGIRVVLSVGPAAPGGTVLTWEYSAGPTDLDCDELVDFNVPYLSRTGTHCAAGSSTCLVSSW